MTRAALRRLVPRWLRRAVQSSDRLLDPFSTRSYAQEGEDILLRRLLGDRPPGLFVDVGALHPIRYSNTWLFYRAGWRGINIDAMPGSMRAFAVERPRDINLEIAINDVDSVLTYFMFEDPALNGFSRELSEGVYAAGGLRVVGTREIRTRRLADVLDEYLPAGGRIDFLTVDTEGLDLHVLRSNDWDRYRPELVLTEVLADGTGASDGAVRAYMRDRGYDTVARTLNTRFFRRRADSAR